MLVDPEILRAFADQVSVASDEVRAVNVGNRVGAAADGLDGSTTQWAARQLGTHVTEIASTIATNITDMGVAVRGAGDWYEVTDTDLAGNFDGLW